MPVSVYAAIKIQSMHFVLEDDNRVSNRTLDFSGKRSEAKFISGISKEFGMGYSHFRFCHNISDFLKIKRKTSGIYPSENIKFYHLRTFFIQYIYCKFCIRGLLKMMDQMIIKLNGMPEESLEKLFQTFRGVMADCHEIKHQILPSADIFHPIYLLQVLYPQSLHETLVRMPEESLEKLFQTFRGVMADCHEILGEYSFCKVDNNRINKALFTGWAVVLTNTEYEIGLFPVP